jgi:hypothetical protein
LSNESGLSNQHADRVGQNAEKVQINLGIFDGFEMVTYGDK